MSACIYGIKNNINGKYYIGQTINLRNRKGRHKYLLKNNKHHNLRLQNAWNKYGEKNFEFIILEDNITLENLKTREDFWIKSIGYYNIDKNGREAYTEQALKNMRDAHLGQKSTRRILNNDEVKYCLSINEFLGECERPLAKLFDCNRIVFRNLFKGETYKEIVDQYNKLDLGEKINLLKEAIPKIGYNIFTKQGGELYGVLVHYFVFDLELSNSKVAKIFRKDSRTIKRIIDGQVLPKSKEIYSKYNKSILKEVALLYYN